MFSKRWPRFCELGDLKSYVSSPDSYFHNFEKVLRASKTIGNYFDRWEEGLRGLDASAWKNLKTKASPYVSRKDSNGRGWSQLFDILNEARAYNYLSRKCSNVRFIEDSKGKRGATPDLAAQLESIPLQRNLTMRAATLVS